jgi:hypothetical protein
VSGSSGGGGIGHMTDNNTATAAAPLTNANGNNGTSNGAHVSVAVARDKVITIQDELRYTEITYLHHNAPATNWKWDVI